MKKMNKKNLSRSLNNLWKTKKMLINLEDNKEYNTKKHSNNKYKCKNKKNNKKNKHSLKMPSSSNRREKNINKLQRT